MSDDEDSILARAVARYLAASEGGRRLDDAIGQGTRYLKLKADVQVLNRLRGSSEDRGGCQYSAEHMRRQRRQGVGFLSRFRRQPEAAALPDRLTFGFAEFHIETEWFESHGGEGDSYSRGYQLLGPRGGEYGGLSEMLPSKWGAAGMQLVFAVGVTHRPKELARPEFAPGQPVALIREPNNPHDKHAIAVFDASRQIQLGYIPRDVANGLQNVVDTYRGYVLREHIDKRSRKRVGVKLIIAPGLTVTATPT